MKQRAKQETTPALKIYHETLREVAAEGDDEVAAVVPTFSSIRTTLYGKRRERLPPLPRSREDIHFDGEWAKTLRDEQFLLRSRDDVYLFSTQANLELLGSSHTLYTDGTFNICPCLFYQILTIHAFKHGKQFPFAYFLLPGKS